MAVNYADKVSAVKAISQKKAGPELFARIFRKTCESVLNSQSAHPWGEEQSRVLEPVSAVKMQRKQARLILRRAVVALMIQRVYSFLLVLLTWPGSDQALRKPRITAALFVCWEERTPDAQTSFTRSGQGHRPEHETIDPSVGCRFLIACPLCWCWIRPKAMHYFKVCIVRSIWHYGLFMLFITPASSWYNFYISRPFWSYLNYNVINRTDDVIDLRKLLNTGLHSQVPPLHLGVLGAVRPGVQLLPTVCAPQTCLKCTGASHPSEF